MSDTDKTKPLRLRMDEPGFGWEMVSLSERTGLSPTAIRQMKRRTAKKNRRTMTPRTKMGGYGYGDDNVKGYW